MCPLNIPYRTCCRLQAVGFWLRQIGQGARSGRSAKLARNSPRRSPDGHSQGRRLVPLRVCSEDLGSGLRVTFGRPSGRVSREFRGSVRSERTVRFDATKNRPPATCNDSSKGIFSGHCDLCPLFNNHLRSSRFENKRTLNYRGDSVADAEVGVMSWRAVANGLCGRDVSRDHFGSYVKSLVDRPLLFLPSHLLHRPLPCTARVSILCSRTTSPYRRGARLRWTRPKRKG